MKNIFFIAVIVCFISCNNNQDLRDQLGEVRMDVSGTSKAKPLFEKGLLLLHSFEYEDAREAFQEAQKIDPEMPMAYWGEAMTHNHSLWSDQDFDEATKALAELNNFEYQSICSPVEQDLIDAVQILYQLKMNKPDRDVAYSEHMAKLTKKYPKNHEVAAFYALSLLGSVEEGRDDEIYGKGAVIAQGILKENPKHPGALHYLIHSYDDPGHATMALDAAHAYAKIAPDASHALHMPSHIFVAMGMWENAIASNIDSYQASLNRMTRKELDGDARGYHAFHWLEYGYLQNNQKEEAKALVQKMKVFTEEKPSVRARVHMVYLKGTYLAETNEWNSEIAEIPVDISDLNISIRSQYYFLEGMRAYDNSEAIKLEDVIGVMENDIDKESFVQAYGSTSVCSNVSREEATQTDLIESKIRLNQLKGLQANRNSSFTIAEEHFLKSIDLESSISYSYGPPRIQKPTHEFYGDWLLGQKRYNEANDQYKLALKFAPKRRLAMIGIKNTQEYL
ncbi:MAG: tetratricopeptide (TPR) repeat protein [Patiriisocius sp.]|jgi:tetratricopeptide (TPR) repeat protein